MYNYYKGNGGNSCCCNYGINNNSGCECECGKSNNSWDSNSCWCPQKQCCRKNYVCEICCYPQKDYSEQNYNCYGNNSTMNY